MRAEDDRRMASPPPDREPDTEPTSDSALQRWSRRKLAATADAEPSTELPLDAQAEAPETTAPTPVDQDCAPAELPDLDSLDEHSDYSAFLSPEVEASVRRVALRKLFGLPCFAVRDGLDDYDDDFGSFEGLGDIVTHEMKRLAAQELARQQLDDGELDDSLTTNPEAAGEPEHLASTNTQQSTLPADQPAASNSDDAAINPDHNTDTNSQEPTAHA